jgi:MGT family glycosyltransferase
LTALALFARTAPWLLRYRQAARRLEQATELDAPAFVTLLNWRGDLNICYTARGLQSRVERYDDSYAFVGPPMARTGADVPFPFAWLETGESARPLVYVSLGTVFSDNPLFFRRCLEAFAGLDVQVVISTGRRVSPAALEPVPANALVREYVPQLALLQRAALFVTHSGVNSVHHALYHGVPLLLVPQQLEQAMVAARVAELGAGLSLRPRQVSAARLRALAEELLNAPSFRARSARLGDALRAAGGAERAAEVIERFSDDSRT